jgi:hypothetical protein
LASGAEIGGAATATWKLAAALFLDLNPRGGRAGDRPMHVVSTAGALIGHLLKPTTISRNQGDPFVSEIQKYRPKG